MEIANNKHLHTRQIIGIFPVLELDIDDVDVPLKNPSISYLDIFFLVSSIIMHVLDMAIDINLAIRYLLANKITYFVWTTVFIFLPSFINVIISRKMQRQDNNRNTESDQSEFKCVHKMLSKKLYCIVVIAFQLAPVLRYYQTLKYAIKAYKFKKQENRNGQKKYYLKMLKEDQDVALLRVFECFLEAAPQQILQLTILLKHYHSSINFEFIHQVASILSSLGSMGWAMASYHRSIRLVQQDKLNIGVTGTVLQFLWHFCTTVSRILSLSVVASIWPLYTAIGCICHWIGMTAWIIIDSHGMLEFCRNHNHAPHYTPKIKERINSILFSLVIGIVHIFIYLNAVDGSTFLKHVFFYIVCFLENITATVFWICTSSNEVKNSWYFNVLTILCIIPFLLGITAMTVYYSAFHPSLKHQNSVNT
ncbi:XK-related protein 6-like [Osmia bicornis bicornis]|uniref:XK-related protein 6-like n=1 Tax=Osmia bicornis bicornis TaxID=1437191 RepID=UPI0010F4ACD6|nr:XK-related protein 6-like [Osmia bicornis bicornis]XP_046141018.1 XK-related protein 6-like [Osmia bicornis bicornis]